jgi:hypothetical protein
MNAKNILRVCSLLLCLFFVLVAPTARGQTTQEDCSSQFYSMADEFRNQMVFYSNEYLKYGHLGAEEYLAHGNSDRYSSLRQKEHDAKEKMEYFDDLWMDAVNGNMKLTCEEFEKILADNPQLKRPSVGQPQDNAHKQQTIDQKEIEKTQRHEMEEQQRKQQATKELGNDVEDIFNAIDGKKKDDKKSSDKIKETLKEPVIDNYVPPAKKEAGFGEDTEDTSLWGQETPGGSAKAPDNKADLEKNKDRNERSFFHEEKTSEQSSKSSQNMADKQEESNIPKTSKGYEELSKHLQAEQQREVPAGADEKDGKIVLNTREFIGHSNTEGEQYIYRSYELTKDELNDLLLYHYWYDPKSDMYVSSYTPSEVSTFPIKPEDVGDLDPELYKAIMQSSITESRLMAENAYKQTQQIEKNGITPEMSEELQNEMVSSAIGEAVIEGVPQLFVDKLSSHKWVKTLSNASSASDVLTIGALAKDVYEYSTNGWVEGAGPKLLEDFGGQEGVEDWLISTESGHEILREYGHWNPTRLPEPQSFDLDRKNKPLDSYPLNDWFSTEDINKAREIAPKVATLLVQQIMLWDQCNSNLRRLDQLEKQLDRYKAYERALKQQEQ